MAPSDEQAIEDQLVTGELVAAHVAPELVETYIEPEGGFQYGPQTPATSFVPSDDEARQLQLVMGALVRVQFCAGSSGIENKRTELANARESERPNLVEFVLKLRRQTGA